jgi:alkanesulfonate monooxygenase SsuD/methylene tetrahydromethanopterin reductase-like flavin-dependent oxidoreductase (luciferase family)
MRFGLLVPTVMESEPCPLERLREAATLAEAYDFETLWVGDHLLFRLPILDATVAVSMLASMTSRVLVGTNVLQLPLHRPIDVAKSFATVSYLSGGRVVLGVGVGGEFAPEWEAAAVDRMQRGARCDEAIDALGWLWGGERKSGTYFASPGVAVAPAPVGGRVPIWVGGRSDAAIRRAARCDGTLNMFVSPGRYRELREHVVNLRGDDRPFTFGLELLARIDDQPRRARQAVRQVLERYHLDGDALEKYTAAGRPEDVAARLADYAEAGVDHISVYLPGPGWMEQAHRLATEVIPLLGAQEPAAIGQPGARQGAS